MKKMLLGLLLVCSVNLLKAASGQQTAIGYNPADFTIVGNATPGDRLANMVVTDLDIFRCSYKVVATEDPRMKEAIEKEIEFSSGDYVDPSNRLKPHFTEATHLVKGKATFKNGSVSIDLRIEDRQGSLTAQAKASGPEGSFFKLVDKASKSLADQMCPEAYYTVITSKKTTTKLKPIENYRGTNRELVSFEKDKDLYYIYVDTDKGKIDQLHVDAKSTRTIHQERYRLNMQSCQYEVESKEEVVKSMGGSPILKSEDAGWGFDKNTIFYVDLSPDHKPLQFTWGRLRKNGRYSKQLTYKKKIPQLAKTIFDQVNDMAAKYRNEAKNSELIAVWKAQIDAIEPLKENRCGSKVALESAMIPPVDGTQDQKIAFKIEIRPSTKEERKRMEAYRKGRF